MVMGCWLSSKKEKHMKYREDEAACADRILAKPDPERIWLGPRCEEVGGDRTWCSAPQDCDDCGIKSVEYIRADLAKSNATEAARVGCICPPTSEKTCTAINCPRKNPFNFTRAAVL